MIMHVWFNYFVTVVKCVIIIIIHYVHRTIVIHSTSIQTSASFKQSTCIQCSSKESVDATSLTIASKDGRSKICAKTNVQDAVGGHLAEIELQPATLIFGVFGLELPKHLEGIHHGLLL